MQWAIPDTGFAITAVPHSICVLFNILLIAGNMRLPTSAHKFLLEGKDTLSLFYLDSLSFFSKPLQEYLLLLQAVWHAFAQSSIFSIHFHSCHKAVQKAAVEHWSCYHHTTASSWAKPLAWSLQWLPSFLQVVELCKNTWLSHRSSSTGSPLSSLQRMEKHLLLSNTSFKCNFLIRKHITNSVNTGE